METIHTRQDRSYSLLVGILDLMLINSCGILVACVSGRQTLTLSAFVGINAIAVFILREWLMDILGIHTNVSWLNKVTKRIVSTVVGLVISLTILPVATLIAFIVIKRNSPGPVLVPTKLRNSQGRETGCLIFRPADSFVNRIPFCKLPLALNLIAGLSLWNIGRYEIIQPSMLPRDFDETYGSKPDEDDVIYPQPNTEKKYDYEHIEQTVWQEKE